MDKTGKIIIEPQYDYANVFYEGIAPVCKDNKYGYIDKTGTYLIKPEFAWADNFS